MKHRISRNRWLALTTSLLAALLLADIALFAVLPVPFLYPLFPAHDRQPAVAAAVLFNGLPRSAPGSTTRPEDASTTACLLRGGRVRLLLVAGGNRPDKGVNGARLMAEYLRGKGVAEGQMH